MKSGPFQRMTGDICVCSRRVCVPLFTGWNMCFRGSFSGGASAKDKGHRGHRERFFCSSGFQIIQGRRQGASRPSFSPFLSLLSPSLIEFPSLKWARLSGDGPDPITHSRQRPSGPTPGGSARRCGVQGGLPEQATAALCLRAKRVNGPCK